MDERAKESPVGARGARPAAWKWAVAPVLALAVPLGLCVFQRAVAHEPALLKPTLIDEATAELLGAAFLVQFCLGWEGPLAVFILGVVNACVRRASESQSRRHLGLWQVAWGLVGGLVLVYDCIWPFLSMLATPD